MTTEPGDFEFPRAQGGGGREGGGEKAKALRAAFRCRAVPKGR